MSAQAERGVVVGSRYRLESILGEGGMAVVWRAVHTETDRAVALKLVRRELCKDDQVREMFVRESRIAARIGKSPHIVDVLDAGVDAALEVPFIAMELLEGEPLDARIKRDGPVAPELAAELLEQLGEALDQAHGAGVFHRDLKPQNLFLARDKKQRIALKVVDFGIAKLAESVTASSTHVGTPAYSAPEQLGPSWRGIAEGRGKVIAAHVSAGTDVWAMGLVAYEMLIGSSSGSLWGATTLAELPVKIVLEPTPLASLRAGERSALLPPGFDAWAARCLDLDAQKRFPSAGEAAAALTPLLRGVRAARLVAPSVHPAPQPAPPAGAPSGYSPRPSQQSPVAGGAPHAGPIGQAYAPAATPPPAHPQHAFTPGHTPPRHPHTPLPVYHSAPPNPPPLDPQLLAWAAHRSAEVHAQGDPRVYAACNPFQFLPPVVNTFRDARIIVRDAQLLLAEVGVGDALRQAMGEDRVILAVLSSQRVHYRAAIRSRAAAGIADGMARGFKALDELVGSPKRATLGDPQFEARYELSFPSPQEGAMALPFALRQLVMANGFTGTLELRKGGFVMNLANVTRFEPQGLDRLLDAAARVYGVVAP